MRKEEGHRDLNREGFFFFCRERDTRRTFFSLVEDSFLGEHAKNLMSSGRLQTSIGLPLWLHQEGIFIFIFLQHRKLIRSYLCYPGMFPITYFLNPVNMIVIVNYTYVWECLECLDICFIVRLSMIKCVLGDILSKLTIDVLWKRLRSGSGMHPNSPLLWFDLVWHVISCNHLSQPRYP